MKDFGFKQVFGPPTAHNDLLQRLSFQREIKQLIEQFTQFTLNTGGGLSKMENNELDAEIDAPLLLDGFLANALALTSPRDVGRLSLVNSVFRSAAEWDVVWERFLPPDYEQILAEAGGGPVTFVSKKEIYLNLCDHPVLIDGGHKSFWLDKLSGKKCYMLAARCLDITWGDTPIYWKWIPLDESRFAEAAELLSVCWLEVVCRTDYSMLSMDTYYVAYLVYKSTQTIYGFDYQSVEVSLGLMGVEIQTKTVFLDPAVYESQRNDSTGPNRRNDGWLEIELGEFFNETGLPGNLNMRVMEVNGLNWKGGIIIQGIEIRPKAIML